MAKMNKAVLQNVNTDAELLSYIINVTPELREEIDLPKQGESIAPIGQIIVNNQRYRNAFINTVNLIGATIIKRNGWENPWNFTRRGEISFGQQVRELINDLCNVYDYNKEFNNKTDFLKTEVPNVLNYIHEVNFQKFYKTTTSDAQISMAFANEGSLFDFIDDAIGMLYESYQYDRYLVDKYQLCRRILDGTVTPYRIANFETKTTREVVADMKAVSNKMTFRSPNYNPAGIRRATSFDNQILIVNCEYDSKITTEVLATSYFRNDAEMRTQLALIDSFSEHDTERLKEVLLDAYIEFTQEEITELSTIPAILISREWFMDYEYLIDNQSNMKQTEFYNPQTLENNHFLHVWGIFSTSPFENAVVFTSETGAVTNVTVSPTESSVSAGQTIKLTPVVKTSGFVNKSVTWSITKNTGEKTGKVVLKQDGTVSIPTDYDTTQEAPQIEITATSIYDSSKTGKATITVL